MAGNGGRLSYASYHLEVQVPMLQINGRADGSTAVGSRPPLEEGFPVAGMLTHYEQFLWQRPNEMTREQFRQMLDEYVRFSILHQLGITAVPVIADRD
jgi:hypothetical protein